MLHYKSMHSIVALLSEKFRLLRSFTYSFSSIFLEFSSICSTFFFRCIHDFFWWCLSILSANRVVRQKFSCDHSTPPTTTTKIPSYIRDIERKESNSKYTEKKVLHKLQWDRIKEQTIHNGKYFYINEIIFLFHSSVFGRFPGFV